MEDSFCLGLAMLIGSLASAFVIIMEAKDANHADSRDRHKGRDRKVSR